MRFRHTVIIAACFLFLLPHAVFAAEGDYPPVWPDGDVTFTVPFRQGNEADTLRALIRDAFVAQTGKKFTPRYVEGRGGADAWARMIDDPQNGTVLTAILLPDVYLRSLQRDSGVSLGNMAVCHIIAFMPCVLWVPAAGPKTLDEFTDAVAEKNGAFQAAGAGSYSTAQAMAKMLDRQTGVRTTYIPYPSTAAAASAVSGGKAGAFWGYSVPVTVPDLPGAAFRPLAVAAANRVPAMPDTPTFRELGIDMVQGAYLGIAVPPDTPELTREEIVEFFSDLARSVPFRENAVRAGFTPMDVAQEALSVFIAQESEAAKQLAEGYILSD